jgi:very-short-patch-repair endonuclease
VFEEEVARALRNRGLTVDHQVGIAGFRIDLAVRDPERPGAYILGIECDGASYHSARSARDRDRIRQQILEDRGWTIHRVWSTDWFQEPEATLRRTLEAVERARELRGAGRDAEPGIRAEPGIEEVLEAAQEPDLDPNPVIAAGEGPDADADTEAGPSVAADPDLEAAPYLEADFRVRLTCEPHDAPRQELMAIVTRIVEMEGPVHMDEVARRLAAVWRRGRAGSRVQEAVQWALRNAEAEGSVERDGRFVWSTKGVNFRPRSRRRVASPTLRQPRMIPPLEMQVGLREIVQGHVGILPGEASALLSRVLGFDSLSSELKEAFYRQIQRMLQESELQLRDGKLYVA